MPFLCTAETSVKLTYGEGTATPVRCKRWTCPHCAEVNRRRVMALARKGRPTAMLTLTVSSKNYDTPDEAARDLKRGLVALRRRIARAFPGQRLPFIAVYEKHQSGWPHLHLLIRAKYLPWKWLRSAWEGITGSYQVDIRKIPTVGLAALYVSKYIGKDLAAFEHCKRWWRSHDFNEKDELTEEERQAMRGWTRHHGDVYRLANFLRSFGYYIEQQRDGRLYWKDPPDAPVSISHAFRAANRHPQNPIFVKGRISK